MSKPIDVKEFAGKVDGSPDIRVIQDLKETAADLHTGEGGHAEITLAGLDEFMRGHPES